MSRLCASKNELESGSLAPNAGPKMRLFSEPLEMWQTPDSPLAFESGLARFTLAQGSSLALRDKRVVWDSRLSRTVRKSCSVFSAVGPSFSLFCTVSWATRAS